MEGIALFDNNLADIPSWVSDTLRSNQNINTRRPNHNISTGGRNSYLTSFAGSLRHRQPGLTLSDLIEALLEENINRCTPHLDESEVRQIADSIIRYPNRRPLNDAGNAERLVDRYGEDLMFCHEWKKWLIWNGSYWEIDKSDQVRGYAIDTARNIINEAENIEENGNNE
jgi:putative DNA primase/helicase